MKTVLAIALLLAAGACKKKEAAPEAAGSNAPAAAAPTPGAPAPAGAPPIVTDEHRHRDRMERRDSMEKDPMPPTMAALQVTMNGHAKSDPATRQQTVCGVIGDYKTQSAALAATAAPANVDATQWGNLGRELTAGVGDLEKACSANDAAAFPASFAHVRRAFHRMMALNHRALKGPAGSADGSGAGGGAGSDEAPTTP